MRYPRVRYRTDSSLPPTKNSAGHQESRFEHPWIAPCPWGQRHACMRQGEPCCGPTEIQNEDGRLSPMRELRIGTEPAYRRIKVFLILSLTLLLATSCERYPRDPRDSLNQIEQSGTLNVGVIANPPWIIGEAPDSPTGVEARLMEQFAEELGVEINWHWGHEQRLFEGIKRYELDFLIGGITTGNPWKRQIGFTIPWFSGHAVVGVPQGHASLSSLEGITVAARRGDGFSEMIQSEGGRIQFVEDLSGVDMPVAARVWEVDALGMKSTGITLKQFQHVMAIPKGENALLMRLEEFLLANTDRQTITELIAREEER